MEGGEQKSSRHCIRLLCCQLLAASSSFRFVCVKSSDSSHPRSLPHGGEGQSAAEDSSRQKAEERVTQLQHRHCSIRLLQCDSLRFIRRRSGCGSGCDFTRPSRRDRRMPFLALAAAHDDTFSSLTAERIANTRQTSGATSVKRASHCACGDESRVKAQVERRRAETAASRDNAPG